MTLVFFAMRVACFCAALGSTAANIVVDRSGAAETFDGIGGLSGGGATTRLVTFALRWPPCRTST